MAVGAARGTTAVPSAASDAILRIKGDGSTASGLNVPSYVAFPGPQAGLAQSSIGTGKGRVSVYTLAVMDSVAGGINAARGKHLNPTSAFRADENLKDQAELSS